VNIVFTLSIDIILLEESEWSISKFSGFFADLMPKQIQELALQVDVCLDPSGSSQYVRVARE